MKESYRKGLASHPGPESCVGVGNCVGEALTGVHAGQVLSCEIRGSGVSTLLSEAEDIISLAALARPTRTPRSRRP